MEKQFQQAWAELTREIICECKSLGSRLHLGEDGTFLGYAQWLSHDQWKNAQIPESDARTRMRDSLVSLETIYRLELMDDLTHGS